MAVVFSLGFGADEVELANHKRSREDHQHLHRVLGQHHRQLLALQESAGPHAAGDGSDDFVHEAQFFSYNPAARGSGVQKQNCAEDGL